MEFSIGVLDLSDPLQLKVVDAEHISGIRSEEGQTNDGELHNSGDGGWPGIVERFEEHFNRRMLLHDIVPAGGDADLLRFRSIFEERAAHFRGTGSVIVAEHDEPGNRHFHVFHDCSWSSNHCRCVFLAGIPVKKRYGSRGRMWRSSASKRYFNNIAEYLLLPPRRCSVYILSGSRCRLPGEDEFLPRGQNPEPTEQPMVDAGDSTMDLAVGKKDRELAETIRTLGQQVKRRVEQHAEAERKERPRRRSNFSNSTRYAPY